VTPRTRLPRGSTQSNATASRGSISKFRDTVSVPKRCTVYAIRSCKNKLEQPATGPPRKFCSDVCRTQAPRQAKKTSERMKKDEWATLQDLYDQLDAEFGFTVHVAATPENTKCERFYTVESDCLE
jgi:DNA N-6-adenine-methyltransferase (Dam)